MTRAVRFAEVFGPTLQGEGPAQGTPAMFVRFSGCNLACSWCDTPFTWDWTGRNGTVYDRNAEQHVGTADDLAAAVVGRAPLLVITGGEPLAQREAVTVLGRLAQAGGMVVHVETNGTLAPDQAFGSVDLFVVSPKLANSGDPAAKRIRPEALAAFAGTGKAVAKFVLSHEDDADEVAAVAALMPGVPVWIMPEGRTPAAIDAGLRRLAPIAIDRGWHLSGRLHVTIWGDERGR